MGKMLDQIREIIKEIREIKELLGMECDLEDLEEDD